MQAAQYGLKSGYWPSLCLLAVTVACLWPAVVNAQSWNPTASDSSGNTAAGTSALANHTADGGSNTAIGYLALSTGTGFNNTASGYRTLYANTTGDNNTASGLRVLESNTTGFSNTASGSAALGLNTTGNNNTANGASALGSNTTGSNNVAMGAASLLHLFSNTTASNNVAVGYSALYGLTSGGSNIALGVNAGKNLITGNRNIYIGSPAGGGHESSVIRIGQTQTQTFIAGIAKTHMSGATVVIKANGQLGVVASSARYKTDIHNLTDASDRLGQLHPVSYQYKTEPGVTHFGLIAEEVDKVMPELVVRDEENRAESVQYLEIIPLLLKERQELRDELASQRALVEQQAKTLDALSRKLDARLAALDR